VTLGNDARFKIGVALGTVGPILFLLTAFAMSVLRHDVIRVEGWASWPSSMAIGGWPGVPQIIAFLTLAVCYPCFAWWALRPAIGRGFIAFTVIAAGELLLAFPTDARGHGRSWHGLLHLSGVLVVSAATLVAAVSITRVTMALPAWRSWRWIALPSVIAGVAVGAIAGFHTAWAKVFFVLAITVPIPLLARLTARQGPDGVG
jgi:hypothetical protein